MHSENSALMRPGSRTEVNNNNNLCGTYVGAMLAYVCVSVTKGE